jgi:hypothetical protein
MPHVKVSLEERLEKLVRHCADHSTPISLFFDPTDEQWHGSLDDITGLGMGGLVAEEHSGDFDTVLEAMEAELEL